MEEFAAMINACKLLFDDVIEFMDGVSLPTECTSEERGVPDACTGMYVIIC
jgi:hypothetical protein